MPVAIVGMAFRFPGDLADEASLWSALKEGRDLVTQIPADRWAVPELQHPRRAESGRSVTFSAGVLSRIEEFDAGFFGISPREAAWLDPQQRLLMELAWESMENSGIVPSSLAGSDCAVYVGISGLDYGTRGLDDMSSMTAYSMTGNTLSIAANRLSYVFDLHGPSLAVDTACSSSLVALHHACNSLRHGESSVALVGGVNLLLHPYPFVGFTKASMLSAGGRCKPFDASGDGYVRAEGGAVLVLKPLDRALADGDTIQAVIRASGVNADGARKTGITIPSSAGQTELMREVLSRSGLEAADIDFIEAHGTGTAVGDPVEAHAIGHVYGVARSNPLPIGSVKANLGHLEAASGMAGLVKTVLALKNRALPPALHLTNPNPNIHFSELNLGLVRHYTALQRLPGRPLVAGVNSFGFGGANAHVLLQEPEPVPASGCTLSPPSNECLPLVLSARSESALRALAGRYAAALRDLPAASLYDFAYSAAFRRERLEKRIALHVSDSQNAADMLQCFTEGASVPGLVQEDALVSGGDCVAFVYSGNGAQWVGMGQALLRESPRFADLLRQLDLAMQPLTDFSLIEELQAAPEQSRMADTTVGQPLLFALQVAVTTLLKESGVKPAVSFGHSVGEIAAAWACGALNLQQAIEVICARSQAQGMTRGQGRMAAVGMSAANVQQVLDDLGGVLDIEIAGINSPGNVTLSGSLESLSQFQKRVENQGVFFRMLELDYAFHSHFMDPIEAQLVQRLAGIEPTSAAEGMFVSTVTGNKLDGKALDARYWWRNVREPVQFAQAVDAAAQAGCRVFVEIGPHAILQRYITESLAPTQAQGRVLPTLKRGDDGALRLRDVVLRLHLLGARDDLKTLFDHPAKLVWLPNYPWQRERHWHPRTTEGLLGFEQRRVHPLLGWRLPGAELSWENTLDPATLPWLADHQVGGVVVYPGAAYAEMALAAAHEWLGGVHAVVEQLDIVAPLVFDEEHGRTLRMTIHARDGSFHIKSRQRLSQDEWTTHAAGRLLQPTHRLPVSRIGAVDAPERQVDCSQHYQLAALLGLAYGPSFQGLVSASLSRHTLQAKLQLPEHLTLDGYLLHPALLDVCFQTLVDFFAEAIEAGQGVALLPVKVGRLELLAPGPVSYLRACLQRGGTRSVLADFELFSAEGRLVAIASGCRFRAAHIKGSVDNKVTRWGVTPWLTPHPMEAATSPVPPLSQLADKAIVALEPYAQQRSIWFKETLPLLEALTLSFGYEACRSLSNQERLHQLVDTPLGRWLAQLLQEEGLLQQEQGAWSLARDAELPASQELWQMLMRDAPACLPQLTLLARAGSQWSALLRGEIEGAALAQELEHSPIAEQLFHIDPAYLGVRLALEHMLQELAQDWPRQCRLRVLEISVGVTELPKVLLGTVSPDRLDYVLALPDDALQARHQAEYQGWSNMYVATYSAADMALAEESPSPDLFDVIVLRHCLHRASSPRAVLAKLQGKLAPGGLLLIAERYSDWSACLTEGCDPLWWRVAGSHSDKPESPLLLPSAWRQLLGDIGWQDCVVFQENAAQELAEGAYLVLAQQPAAPRLLSEQQQASWLLLVDSASADWAEMLAAQLVAVGQSVTVSTELNAVQNADHVVHLLGWSDSVGDAHLTLTRLLHTVQHLSSHGGQTSRLWVLTRGGVLAQQDDSPVVPNPAQAAVWGMGRVVMNECPQLSCTLIDLAADLAELRERVISELLRPDGANEIILTTQARHTPMLQEHASVSAPAGAEPRLTERFRLDFQVPGQLRNLLWLSLPEREIGAQEVEVETQATGLNFRDVMYTMGLLPDEAVENGFAGASLGLEFSGVVTRVGAQVRHLQPGDSVMGFGSACFASHVITQADAVAILPAGWSFEAAATVPTVFLTVYYALKQLADLQPGERVLIHGAAGGVGIAAIQLAKHLGAEVFATAGSAEKRSFVQLLGADHVFDSRSLQFADDILELTSRQGVDVVLNSLAGEAMRRSLAVLRPFGRFLELGKRDFFENTPVGLRPFKDNISYFGIDADQLLNGRPQLATSLFQQVMELFHAQVLVPLPYRSYAAEHVVDAFRAMQQARHIGKIVVTMGGKHPDVQALGKPPVQVHLGSGTWLVTGGLSGFGLASARWLAQRGVESLVLVGRRGLQTPGADEAVKALHDQGVQVVIKACDIEDPQAVAHLIQSLADICPPIRGVLHAAAQFDDRLLAQLDGDSIARVVGAKLVGAWNLHRETQHLPLTHFVLYASITTAIGNPGQANYVAANAGLEGLAALRRHMGLPATCIAWGPVGDAGYLARNEAVKDSLAQRLGRPPMSAQQALDQLDDILQQNAPVVMAANFDWSALARLLPSSSGSRFTVLNRHRNDNVTGLDATDFRAQLAGKSATETAALVQALVTQQVAQTLCIAPEKIAPQVSLHELGMDSLMAVELALGLEQRFGIQLPAMMLNDAPTVQTVASRIIDKLIGATDSSAVDTEQALVADLVQQHGGGMTQEQIQELTIDAQALSENGAQLIE